MNRLISFFLITGLAIAAHAALPTGRRVGTGLPGATAPVIDGPGGLPGATFVAKTFNNIDGTEPFLPGYKQFLLHKFPPGTLVNLTYAKYWCENIADYGTEGFGKWKIAKIHSATERDAINTAIAATLQLNEKMWTAGMYGPMDWVGYTDFPLTPDYSDFQAVPGMNGPVVKNGQGFMEVVPANSVEPAVLCNRCRPDVQHPLEDNCEVIPQSDE
mmetsp:Transcript_5413/g.10567  ORF Transcript_5413/g.10567 Transcript_5413/m.10567 type:complete len:215 (-) Transcript_5413:44-688(-)|eukprot:CAMPEP_0173415164 /NCGR_PEP_ID=MMETSP1356-20130122/84718_1 /TAXON_ID=77927 ORGANISM="Hemiselmis virescens, Strain PCC157" /NCGR_SAMPLE_ID=MMETSP1356 /ASSEMBLY_ACC=CAM_ASM_000847 /LENGTH=214 /DNA_ID=CAMNT_0014377399 /DNA_START=138 /DNA_END=782 /DNA_ORIENTATION=-